MLTSKTQREIWETIQRIKKEILMKHVSKEFDAMGNVSTLPHQVGVNGSIVNITSGSEDAASPLEIVFDSFLQGYTNYLLTSAIPEYSTQVGNFIGLSDTPLSYDSQAGKIVRVKPDETGLEFVEAQISSATHLDGGFSACQYLESQVYDAGGAI
jgi:hypothetical protein